MHNTICLVVIVCMVYKQEVKRYLEEGQVGERLDFHSKCKISSAGYLIIHNPIYNISQLLVGISLMLLAFLERPTFIEVPYMVSMYLLYIN